MRKPVVHKALVDCLNHTSFASEVEKMYAWTYINAMIRQQNFQSKWKEWNYAIYPPLFFLFWLVTFCHV